MARTSGFLPVLLLICLFHLAPSQSLLPTTGPAAHRQRALDLKGSLNVLMISLEPGYEDLASLAYYRLHRGAKIMSVYVTNGSSGESDLKGEYPPQLAARKREEAASILWTLEGEAYFLNMPEVAAARDTSSVREAWSADSLQLRLMRVLTSFKPDLVLLTRDWEGGSESPRLLMVQNDLLRAIQRVASKRAANVPPPPGSLEKWDVERLAVDDASAGTVLPVAEVSSQLNKSYEAIGRELGRQYASMAVQRLLWREGARVAYRQVFPAPQNRNVNFDRGVPRRASERLRGLEEKIQSLTNGLLAQRVRSRQAANPFLKRIVGVLADFEPILARSFELDARDRRAVLHWKEGLENLRAALLGVEVSITIADTLLTNRQLTYFRVDTVKGISSGGTTELLLPGVGSEWFLNERQQRQVPLALNQEYRLLWMQAEPFIAPHWQFGLEEHTLGRQFHVYVIHRATKPEDSFLSKTTVRMWSSPRFVIEVFAPFVRAYPGERLPIRLTNISRDGVRDTLDVRDSLVVSSRSPFWLTHKGSTHDDTLSLRWVTIPPEGSYLHELKIGGFPVSQFVARSFAADVDTTKRVGIVSGIGDSPTLTALRRLGVSARRVDPDHGLENALRYLDVLVIDQRALTFHQSVDSSSLRTFVDRGGHVLVLSQDAAVWNERPLWRGITLERSIAFEPTGPLMLDSTHTFLTSPNNIVADDWEGWLFRRAFNKVVVAEGEETPVADRASGSPFIVTRRAGAGRFTYVDLNLQHQWLDVQAGPYRLFANLLSK